MTDHPVLIPTDEGPVGGIVGEPSGEARAALLLLSGYGRPARSGTNSFWTRLARDLAACGLVVLRVDYSREGETLPIGEGVRGQANKSALDARLLAAVLPWFQRRLDGLELFVAGSCSGARGAVELAGRDHPDTVAGTFLIVPHFRVLEGAERAQPDDDAKSESGDPDAVDPAMVDCFREILARAPSWILVGEDDEPDVPLLLRSVGATAHELEVEVVPGVALHFLDQPDLQEEAGRRLRSRLERALAPASEVRGSPAPRATASR